MRFSIKKIINFLNYILIVCSLFFSLVGSTFYFYGDAVTALGEIWIKAHTRSALNKTKNAILSLSTGQSKDAESELKTWREVNPGDRVYSFKRQIFVELIKDLRSRKNYAKLADHAGRWLSMDERDVIVRAYWADALRHVEGRQVEGKEALARLWSRFPRQSLVAQFYAENAAEDGDLAALRAVKNTIEINSQQLQKTIGWRVYWDTGRGFNQSESGPALVEKHKGEWQLFGDVSPRAIRVRIDPPPDSIVRFSNFFISLGDAPQNVTVRAVSRVHMIERDGSWLQTTGGNDPYLIVNTSDLAEKENAADTVTFIGRFQVEPARNKWLETLTERFDL
jgi:hypothetical protein